MIRRGELAQYMQKRAVVKYLNTLGWGADHVSYRIAAWEDGPITGESLMDETRWELPMVIPFVAPMVSGELKLRAGGRYAICMADLPEIVFEGANSYPNEGVLQAYVLMEGRDVICARLLWLGRLSADYLREAGYAWPKEYSFETRIVPENFCPAQWPLEEVRDFWADIVAREGAGDT